MLAVLVTLALFLAWFLIGLAALVGVRADTQELRVALTAPVLGSALTVLPLFVLSNAGVSMETAALPVGVVLLLGSAVLLVLRRPRLSIAVAPVVGLCFINLLLVGRPMFDFGFDWIANANGDMALYVLSATQLMGHGLLTPIDLAALADNRELATSVQVFHLEGLRPGAQIGLAGLAAFLNGSPLGLYMPMLLALSMTGISAVGALAMQASRRWWAASVAAALLVASPMAGYGVLQQLMPQVWGLSLAVALLAWLMRPEMHQNPGPRLPDLFVVSALTTALFVVYPELGATLFVAYCLYVALLQAQRRVSLRAVGLLWGVPLLVTAVIVNTFLSRELGYLGRAAQFGVSVDVDNVELFGYALVPTALAGVSGLQQMFAVPATPHMEVSILVSALLAVGILVVCVIAARKGVAAALVLLADLALGILLAKNGNDFGLFKLYMYIQPFLAAVVAVWLASLTRRSILAAASLLLVIVMGAQLSTLETYVDQSRDPIDLPDASAPDLLPAFRASLEATRDPFVVVSENLVLATLQGAAAGESPLYFLSRNVFDQPWKERAFPLSETRESRPMTFRENRDASRILSEGSCVLSLPTGAQLVLNRRTFPEDSPNLAVLPCGETRNTLVFIASSLGQPATLPDDLRAVSFWQLEGDVSFPGRTLSGFGRYALFQILNPTPGIRLALEFTTRSTPGGSGRSYRLPPAALIGFERVGLPVAGSGSARVFSPPLRPQLIGGRPYIVLDMGREGQFARVHRPGVTGLWGESVLLDPRALTSYVRDVSLVSQAEYGSRSAPVAIRRFPDDLANVNLEYSGFFEDGWVGKESYAVLAGGPASTLVVRANVQSFQFRGQRLTVRLNGRQFISRAVRPGRVEFRVRVPASERHRRIELQWARETRLRGTDDTRSAAARLTFLGLVPPPAAIDGVAGLRHPGLVSTGIDRDGWLRQRATAVLAGGGRGTFVFRAQVPPLSGGRVQHVRVLVDGRPVASQRVQPGPIEIRAAAAASATPRRVTLVWAGITRVAANDRREAAARLAYLGFLREYAPKLVRVPADLADPRLSYNGIYKDGWLQKRAQLLLAGGASGNLTLRIQAPRDNRLNVLVNGKTVVSRAVKAGVVDLKAPIPPSSGPRQIQLRWANSVRISKNDPRQAAALLQQIAVGSPQPPKALLIPADLVKPNVSSSGIYKDGWLKKEARVLLAGGARGELAIRAEVIARKRQHLDVVVNGKTIAARDITPGLLELHIPIGPSLTTREVELRWSTTSRISARDRRQAAALLKSIAIETTGAPASLEVADLARSNVAFSGIYKDGWLQQEARVLLTGGPAGELAVRAEVTAATGRHLVVVVNGRVVTGVEAPPGRLDLKIPIGPSPSARTVELRWSTAGRISANDPRRVAALLQSIAIRSIHGPTSVRVDDLASGQLAYAGIYKDGWLQRNGRVLLAGGDAGHLTVRAEVTVKSGQRLRVFANGRRLARRATPAGPLNLTVALPASRGPRMVELRWATTGRIGPDDPRRGSALLKLIAIDR